VGVEILKFDGKGAPFPQQRLQPPVRFREELDLEVLGGDTVLANLAGCLHSPRCGSRDAVSQNDSRILSSFHSQTVQRMVIVRTVIGTARAKHMPKSHLKLVTPAIVNRTVTPRRPPNADLRTREHLTEVEVERLMDAARKNRWGHRDATMVLVAYRHGFRPAEHVDLRWDQIDFASGTLRVRRVKRGTPSTVRNSSTA
jgi:hypothetical protein